MVNFSVYFKYIKFREPPLAVMSICFSKFVTCQSKNLSISKFVKKKKSDQNINKTENMIDCSICSQKLKYSQIFEHEDYHYALNLISQNEKKETEKSKITKYFK